MPTAQDVANWMLSRLQELRFLDQDTAVGEIGRVFGDEFTHINDNGNQAINRDVLDAFRKLTPSDVVWDRSQRMWRYREEHDDPGKRQA